MVDQNRKFQKIIDIIQLHGIFTIGDFKEMNRVARGFYSEISKNIRFNEFQNEINRLANRHSVVLKRVQGITEEQKGNAKEPMEIVPKVGKGFMRFVPLSKRPEIDSFIPHGKLTVLRKSID